MRSTAHVRQTAFTAALVTCASWIHAGSSAAQLASSSGVVAGSRSCAAKMQAVIEQRFPSDRFVVGRGVAIAADADEAHDRSKQAALGDISTQLAARVVQELEAHSQQIDREASQSSRKKTRTTSSMSLRNVQFELECYDPETRESRTLAVLDRAKTTDHARAALAKLNDDGRALRAQVRSWLEDGRIGNAGQAIVTLRALVRDAQPHVELLQGLGSADAASFLSEADVKRLREDVLQQARTRVVLDEPARSMVEAELSRQHFPIAAGPRAKAAFEVRGAITTVSVARSNLTGAVIAELQADVALSQAGSPDSIEVIQLRERNGGSSERDAVQVTRQQLAAKIGARVRKALVQHVGLDAGE